MDKQTFEAALTELGITKREFAEKCDISHHSITKWQTTEFPRWVDVCIEGMLCQKRLENYKQAKAKLGC